MIDEEDVEWWKQVYLSAIRSGRHPAASKDCADESLLHLQELNLNVYQENDDDT